MKRNDVFIRLIPAGSMAGKMGPILYYVTIRPRIILMVEVIYNMISKWNQISDYFHSLHVSVGTLVLRK